MQVVSANWVVIVQAVNAFGVLIVQIVRGCGIGDVALVANAELCTLHESERFKHAFVEYRNSGKGNVVSMLQCEAMLSK